MASDRTNQTNLTELKTEIETDPLNIGYASENNTNKMLDLINLPENNPGGETTGQAFTPKLMLDVIDPNDLTLGGQFSEGELEWLKLLMEASSNRLDNLEEFRTKFRDLFPANSNTVANLDAAVRTLSRAEVLWGEGTVISRDDWFAARDNG